MLNLAAYHNSLARSTKSTISHLIDALSACRHKVSGSFSLPSRGSFHLSLTVLYTIGHQVVFSLGRWSCLLPTKFHVLRGTPDQSRGSSLFVYVALTLFGMLSQAFQLRYLLALLTVHTPSSEDSGLGYFPFARHYLGNHFCFLFLRVLRCFSSPSSPPIAYVFSYG